MKSAAEIKESKLVRVTMSEQAAAQLAEACRWAVARAEREWDDERLTGDQRQTAILAYEWLDWGARWLVNEGARA